jgi:hypothetical protein
MNINFKRLLHTEFGKIIISILLGLGIASLFYKVCNDKNCIQFQGPIISEFDGKIFQHGNDCFRYKLVSGPCDELKNTVELAVKPMDGSIIIPSATLLAV